MLPSKIIPTYSPALLTTGLPLLPPMISAVHTKLNGVSRSKGLGGCSQLWGNANGGFAPCKSECLNAPPMVVHGGIGLPSCLYPFTWPNARRSVNVASGYELVPSMANFALAILAYAC